MGKIKGGWKKKKVAGCSPSRILQVIYIVRIFELLSSSADGRRLIIMQMTLVRGNANGCVRWIAMEASPSTGHLRVFVNPLERSFLCVNMLVFLGFLL